MSTTPTVRVPSRFFSENSTEAVQDSLWFSSDFILAAGMVIIQRETRKVVLIHSENRDLWFLPKGRKDVGESLEQTALREAHEESGYRAKFLPLKIPTRAPRPPAASGHASEHLSSTPSQTSQSFQLNTEPIYVGTRFFERIRPGQGGEYIAFWYVGYIEQDATREENTRMPDEEDFVTHLMSHEDALRVLEKNGNHEEARVLSKAWKIWMESQSV